jgi:phosphate-selective porin OprO/OprP
MKLNKTLFLIAIAAGLVPARFVHADDTTDAINALKQQIQELDQKVRELEHQKELDTEAADARAKEAPRLSVGSGGLTGMSGDSNFVFSLKGLLQVDNRSFASVGGVPGHDTFLIRRARPIFQGTLYRDFDFIFVPDFAGATPQIFDAYLNYRYAPWLQLRAGKFKTPFGLENLQSDPYTFFNERALTSQLVPNRDIGFQLWGEVADGIALYQLGAFNGVGDGRNSSNQDFENDREVAARLFVQPFRKTDLNFLKGLGFGVAGTWGNVSSNATGLSNGFLTDGQQQFFAYTNGVVADGTHWRLSPQAYYYWGPLGILGEYVISDQEVRRSALTADLRNTAWQVAAGWMLTGEDASYNSITVKHPFDLSACHWGAFQLVGRYAQLDVDNDTFPLFSNPGPAVSATTPAFSASAAQAWSVGLNWFLNKNLRVNTSFSRTTFTGQSGPGAIAPAAVTRQPEEVVFTRVQLAF